MATDWVTQWNAMQGGKSAPAAPAASDWVNEWNAAQAKPAKTTTPNPSFGWKSDFFGPGETALNLGTGMIGQAAGGLAGLGDAVVHHFDKNAPQPADVVRNVESALTYQPRTRGAQAVDSLIAYPFQKLAQGADWAGQKVSNVTGSPFLGAATNTAIQSLPQLLGAKLPALRDTPTAPEVPPSVAAARSLGLKLTPTEANVPGGAVGRTLESLTNHAKLERAISRKNAPAVTAAAARDVGIKGRVTPESISAAYEPHDAVYKEVEQIPNISTDGDYQRTVRAQEAPGSKSFPKAQDPRIAALREAYDVPQFTGLDAVAKIRELRKEGQARAYGKYDPPEQAYGQAQLDIAKALEDQIDRHLNQNGDSDLISRYRGARKGMAKLASFERAWKAGNEEAASAKSFGKQLEKGVPLSGATRTIAESARKYPRAFQDIQSLRNEGPLSNLDLKLDGLVGAASHGGALAKLAGAVKAAPVFLASPIVRAVLSSDLYQNAAFGPHAISPPSALGLSARALPFTAAGQAQPSPLASLLAQPLLAR